MDASEFCISWCPWATNRSWRLHFATGVPGHPFTDHDFPGGTSTFRREAVLTRDRTTGELSVASNLVVGRVSGTFVITKRPGHGWSKPLRVARGRPEGEPQVHISGLAATRGRVWLGISQGDDTRRDVPRGPFLIARNPRGFWSSYRRVRHTVWSDELGPIAVTKRGGLHALFTAARRKDGRWVGGIRHVYRSANGRWSRAKLLSHGRYDAATHVAALPGGGFRYAAFCRRPCGH